MTGWRGLAVAAGVLAATGLAGAVALTADPDGAASARPASAAAASPSSTERVERGRLVARETVTGTLGYAASAPLLTGSAGTVTRPPREGRVVRPGHALYELDGRRTGWVLRGERPAWRALGPGSEGEDVRDLERNLRALGADPDRELEVDGTWDAATSAAVRRFQRARDVEADGVLELGEVVFRPGAVRVGAVEAEPGRPARPGERLATLSSTRRVVTVDLAADRQALARVGDAVTVDLPDGTSARGRVVHVASVASPPTEEGGDPTVEVTVRLTGRGASGSGLDQAPVEVGLVRERTGKAVLHVPVSAVLARPGGSFAVEVVRGGRTRTVPVRLGLEADGRVAVAGAGLHAGERVVVPS